MLNEGNAGTTDFKVDSGRNRISNVYSGLKGSNAVLLYCFAKYCKEHITGLRLLQAFSTSKENLFFDFGQLALGVRFYKGYGWLYLTETARLPKKNRLQAFTPATSLQVLEVIPFVAERCMQLRFQNGVLEFRLFGNQSTVIWYTEETPSLLFPKKDSIPLPLKPASQDNQEPAIDLETWIRQSRFVEEWMLHGFSEHHEKMTSLQWFISLANWMCLQPLCLRLNEDGPPEMGICHETEDQNLIRGNWPELSAIFTIKSIRYDEEFQKKRELQSKLKRTEQQLMRQISALDAELHQISERNYKLFGDNLMAWLHTLEKGMEMAEVLDVYSGMMLSVPLKKDLNPQENATRYYRKAKKEYLQRQNREELKEKLRQELDSCRKALSDLESVSASELPEIPEKKKSTTSTSKYFCFHCHGFEIRVGKNADGNDQLLREAGKTDFWLHARNYKGAHVIIRSGNQPQRVPVRVKETAASLAAWNSEARGSQLVPVIITQRKFVRKSKGLQKGAVIVEREEVILIEPRPPADLELTD